MHQLFFLFLGCVVSGAIFYELERGKACFVGHECRWMNKSVLTPVLAQGLPLGKRVLIQNTVPVILTDMLRSTWLALVTFTTVGYGDVTPRTSLGRLFDIVAMVFSACYTAMPLSLVGGQFYICYEAFVADEKMRRVRACAWSACLLLCLCVSVSVEGTDTVVYAHVCKQESWNSAMEHERRSGKSGRRISRHTNAAVAPLADPTASTAAPTVAVPTSSESPPVSSDRQPPLPTSSAATTPLPVLEANGSPARLSVLTRALQTRPSAKVLAQFVLVDKVVTRVIADLNSLNLQTSPQRRGSLRWSTREVPDKDDVEQKIVSNMRFVEVRRRFAYVNGTDRTCGRPKQRAASRRRQVDRLPSSPLSLSLALRLDGALELRTSDREHPGLLARSVIAQAPDVMRIRAHVLQQSGDHHEKRTLGASGNGAAEPLSDYRSPMHKPVTLSREPQLYTTQERRCSERTLGCSYEGRRITAACGVRRACEAVDLRQKRSDGRAQIQRLRLRVARLAVAIWLALSTIELLETLTLSSYDSNDASRCPAAADELKRQASVCRNSRDACCRRRVQVPCAPVLQRRRADGYEHHRPRCSRAWRHDRRSAAAHQGAL